MTVTPEDFAAACRKLCLVPDYGRGMCGRVTDFLTALNPSQEFMQGVVALAAMCTEEQRRVLANASLQWAVMHTQTRVDRVDALLGLGNTAVVSPLDDSLEEVDCSVDGM